MTSTPAYTPALPSSTTARHFSLAAVALAMGGFAIGTTEFVTMGLLPDLAGDLRVPIPLAGHVIAAYALGVVVGAPLIAILGAALPRRGLLLALMGTFALGNAASALAVSYEALTVARFFTGLPHGAFFGVPPLVAAGMAGPGRRGKAVTLVMLGLPVANVAGVPAATWMGQHLGWRSAYWAVTLIAVLTIALVLLHVPATAPDPRATGRRELSAFTNPQVWLTLLVGAIGFGGMFAMYSYIAPTVTDVADLPASAVPLYLLAFGLGSVLGTLVGGHLADWSMFRSLLASSVAMGLALALFTVTASHALLGALTVFLVSAVGSVLVMNLQLRLMHVAGDAQMLGAALNNSSLNAANALGAWLGGLVISAGWGYTAPSWVGVGLSVAGLGVLLASAALHRRTTGAPATILPAGRGLRLAKPEEVLCPGDGPH